MRKKNIDEDLYGVNNSHDEDLEARGKEKDRRLKFVKRDFSSNECYFYKEKSHMMRFYEVL